MQRIPSAPSCLATLIRRIRLHQLTHLDYIDPWSMNQFGRGGPVRNAIHFGTPEAELLHNIQRGVPDQHAIGFGTPWAERLIGGPWLNRHAAIDLSTLQTELLHSGWWLIVVIASIGIQFREASRVQP